MEFPGYKVIEEVARGGMGIVFKAQDLALGRLVAIKVPTSETASSPTWRRLTREAKVLAQLRHPNVVRVLEVGEVDDRPYIVMEWIEGQDLEAYRAASQSLSPERAAAITARLAEAVHYLHESEVLHRDLKPENVLIGPKGEPTLVDFGIAQDLQATASSTLTQRGRILGTPLYASPEQLLGRLGEIGPASDVFGLGGILYFLLSGRSPRGEPTTLVQLLGSEVAPLEAVPGDLAQICEQCLARDPQARPASAAALAQSLTRWSLTRGGNRALRAAPIAQAAARPPTLVEEEPALSVPLAPAEPKRSLLPALLLALACQTLLLTGLLAAMSPSAPPAAASATSTPAATPAPELGLLREDIRRARGELAAVREDLRGARAEQRAAATRSLAELEALRARGSGPSAPRSPRVDGKDAPPILVPDHLRSLGGGRYQAIPDGSLLAWVPPGSRRSPSGSEVRLREGVFLGVHEVSWGQYVRFCQETGRGVPSARIDARARGGSVFRAKVQDPVFNVDFDDARDYAAWAKLRLPTEREWRYAALGCDPVDRDTSTLNVADRSRDWRWGAGRKDFKEENAGRGRDGFAYTAPVQFFLGGRSRDGCYSLLGNVSEWVTTPDPDAEAGSEGKGPLVFCGASWYLPPNRARWDYRFRVPQTFRGNALGFRVAISQR